MKVFLKYILVMLCVSTWSFSFSYNERVDSLEQALDNLTEPVDRANTLLLLGNEYLLYANDTAIFYFQQAMNLAQRTTDVRLKADVNYRLGLAYQYIDPIKSAEYTLDAVALAEKAEDGRLIAYSHNMLGTLYRSNGEWDKAMDEYIYTLDVAEAMDDSLMMSRSYNNIGIVHMLKGEYAIGEEFWLQSLDIKLRLGLEDEAAATMSNIALYYKDIGRYEEAHELLDKALEINFSRKDYESISFCYTIMGDMYWRMQKDHDAVESYELALAYSDTINSYFDKIDPYRGLSTVLDSLGRYKEALHYHRLYVKVVEDLNSENNARITRELTTQFDTEKKEQENAALKGLNDAKDAQIELEEANVRYLWLGLGLAGIILILIVFILGKVRVAKREVEDQKHIVEEKNREITDSISYAKRLQDAILPTEENISKNLKENFVLYLPKDIVAGDFYWMEPLKSKTLFAVADCTGHGVPGAMVSVVCHNALNRAVREFGLEQPSLILDKVTDLVIETFEKSTEEVKDGMDISLCAFDFENNKVQFSGANNGLYHLSKGVLNEVKPTKQPVGKYANRQAFQNHEISFEKGDVFYMFTDGYADQFGGDKGKKMKYKPFKELLLEHHLKSPEDQKRALFDAFHNWMSDYEQVDDICLVGIRV